MNRLIRLVNMWPAKYLTQMNLPLIFVDKIQLWPIILVLLYFGVCIFAGLLINVFPWWFVLVLVMAPILLLLITKYPVAGLLLIVFIVFNVIPERFLPRIPVMGGKLKLYDLLLIYLVLIGLFNPSLWGQHIAKLLGPSLWPTVYLFSFILIGVTYGRFYLDNSHVLTEARNHIGWLIMPLMALNINTPRKFTFFLQGLLVGAVILSLYVIVQSTFAIQFTGGRVEYLDIGPNRDIVRSTAGGGVYIIILALIYFINSAGVSMLKSWWKLAITFILLWGLAVTFGRGIWVATIAGLLLSSFLLRGARGTIVSIIIGGFVLALTLVALYQVQPRMVEALLDRAVGISTEIKQGRSFYDRQIENEAAIRMISKQPLLGVGLGGEYKPVSLSNIPILNSSALSGEELMNAQARYIHNSYLYFPLKMGIFASAIPLAFVLAFVSMYQHWLGKLNYQQKVLPVSLAGAFASVVVTSFTQPEWASPQGVVSIGLLFMLMLLSKRHHIYSSADKRYR